MNLFLLGVGVGPQASHRLTQSLGRVGRSHFPETDPGTAWQATGPGVCAVGVHRPHTDHDRPWVREVRDGLVAVDGFAIGHHGLPLDAAAAGEDWARITAAEGRFSALRVDTARAGAELMVDALGMAQVYVLEEDGAHYFSNSVALLQAAAAGQPVLDLVGASHLASLGWVPGDRTLDDRVRVLPAGAHVRWDLDGGLRADVRRAALEALAAERAPLTPDDVRELGDVLVGMVQAAAASAGRLDSPLTAGRDTRLLAALAVRGGLRPTYYTWGRPQDRDVQVAVELATRFGWSHELRARGDEDLVSTWDLASHEVIRRGDGLVSLRHATTPRVRPQDTVVLSGAGGELCRTFYSPLRSLVLPPGDARVADAIVRRVVRGHRGLVSASAVSSASTYLRDYVADATASGVRPFDVIALFYADTRMRRWVASNVRVEESRNGVTFAPFCTKAFADVCFRATPLQLQGEWIGTALMSHLAPQLLSVPYDVPWRPATRSAVAVQALTTARGRLVIRVRRKVARTAGPGGRLAWRKQMRSAWFEPLRETLRRPCLDQASSELWEVVDRQGFERLTAASTPPGERMHSIDGILDTLTLFEYRHGAAGPWARSGADGRS